MWARALTRSGRRLPGRRHVKTYMDPRLQRVGGRWWKVATADGTVALTLCEAKRGRYLASRHSQAAAPTSDMPREIAKARLALRSAAVADAWIGDVKQVGDLIVNRREP
jgi:hypothetical protein